MKVILETSHPTDDASVQALTGKSRQEWFAMLDAFGGVEKGRREMNNHLYWDNKLDLWWATTLISEYELLHGVRDRDGRAKGYTICSTKTIAAPIEKVYEAWTSADALSGWFGKGVKAEVADGGTYSSTDGDSGQFKRVRSNKDIRMTWERGEPSEHSIVDVAFTAKSPEKCQVLVTHDRIQSRAEADGLRNGWAEVLDRLKAKLELG